MLEALVILAVLALVVIAAVFGSDSRDGNDWVTHPRA
jgi:hypothetical protein